MKIRLLLSAGLIFFTLSSMAEGYKIVPPGGDGAYQFVKHERGSWVVLIFTQTGPLPLTGERLYGSWAAVHDFCKGEFLGRRNWRLPGRIELVEWAKGQDDTDLYWTVEEEGNPGPGRAQRRAACISPGNNLEIASPVESAVTASDSNIGGRNSSNLSSINLTAREGGVKVVKAPAKGASAPHEKPLEKLSDKKIYKFNRDITWRGTTKPTEAEALADAQMDREKNEKTFRGYALVFRLESESAPKCVKNDPRYRSVFKGDNWLCSFTTTYYVESEFAPSVNSKIIGGNKSVTK